MMVGKGGPEGRSSRDLAIMGHMKGEKVVSTGRKIRAAGLRHHWPDAPATRHHGRRPFWSAWRPAAVISRM